MQKKRLLIDFLKKNGKAILLYSGGFDSSAILGAAVEANVEIEPIWLDNGFNRATKEIIEKQARNMGCKKVKTIKLNPGKKVLKNSVERCFFCKNELIKKVKEYKDAPLFDGSNLSDSSSYRPGLKAIKKEGVISPLARLNISATEAAEMAIKMGADPYLANLEGCMATRFNYDLGIDKQKIELLRELELSIIKETQDYKIRCRIDDHNHLRIEPGNDNTLELLCKQPLKDEIINKGKKIAVFVTLDLEGTRKNMFDQIRNL
ncbi:phosphoadenosine phosphosulfate reductase family protein [Marinilabiliaceae bacterium ANBcel2]|nr:phosphoadenosine phosphosulfate reductase family protein [Marinilabiliaceae bacterium ANBcel2]